MGVEVMKDEADKKRQDPSGKYDPFEVKNKKPGYRYRLLNKNDRNIERKTAEGFEIVQGNDPEQLANLGASTVLKKGEDLDTTRRFNDVVLARIPEEKYQEKVRENRKRIDRMTASTRGNFKEEVGSSAFEGSGGGGWAGSMSESEFTEMIQNESKSKKE